MINPASCILGEIKIGIYYRFENGHIPGENMVVYLPNEKEQCLMKKPIPSRQKS